MSRTVDERIVEMRFDNRQFEQNIQTTMGSLDKLKQSLKLDGVTKGFQDLDRASRGISLNNISSGVETITKRFSTLGIIGMEITRKLTDGFINLATKGIGGLVSKITEGGKRRAANIENAHFQLQGLLKDEEKVQAIMSDAMGSVDGTAYAYDEAAKAASQFAASGLEAGKQMQSSLRAITGVAAMTNSEYEDISRIFTTVAGNGRLMGDQLLQLSGRGLNAAATLKDYFNGVGDGSIEAEENVATAIKSLSNGLDVSEGDIREWVSKGKLSFEIFSAAMDDAFGEHAKKANETFTGALSNINAALSRTGAKFYSPLIEQNGALVQLFNTIRERINDVNKGMDGFANLFVRNVIKGANALKEFLSNVDTQKRIFEIMPKLYHTAANSLYVLQNVLTAVGRILKPIGQAFQYFIPNDILDRIRSFTSDLLKLTKGLSVSESTVSKVYKTFRGLFSIFDIGVRLITSFIRAFTPSSSEISKFANSILDSTASIGDWITALDRSIKKNDTFFKAFTGIKNAVVSAALGIKTGVSGIIDAFKNLSNTSKTIATTKNVLSDLVTAIKDFVTTKFEAPNLSGLDVLKEKLTSILEPLKNLGKFIDETFGEIITAISTAASQIPDLIPSLTKSFSSFFSSLSSPLRLNGGGGIFMDLLNGGLLTGIGLGITQFIVNLTKLQNTAGSILATWRGIGGKVYGILLQVTNGFKVFQATLKADILLRIAAAIGILSLSLISIASIDPTRLGGAVAAISGLFIDLAGAMKVLTTFMGPVGVKELFSISGTMIKMSAAVFILASALNKIGDIDSDALSDSMIVISGLLWELTGVAVVLGRSGNAISTGATDMIGFAVAINILAGALKKISEISAEDLERSFFALEGLIASMTLSMGLLSRYGGQAKTSALAMVGFAAATRILASALAVMSSIDSDGMGRAFAGLAVSIGAMIAAFNLIKPETILSKGAAMTMFANSMLLLSSALKIMGSMNIEQMGIALLGLAGSILIMVAAFNEIKAEVLLSKSVAMIAFATSMIAISAALKIMGSMNLEQMGVALMGLAGTMLIMVMAFNELGKSTVLKGTAAMIAISGAIAIMAPALRLLGTMSIDQMAIALITLAGSFIIIGFAAGAFSPVIPAILGFAGAIALLGVAVASIGAGVSLFATGMATLAVSGVAGAAAIISMIGTLQSAVPTIAAMVAQAVITFATTIGNGAAEIIAAVTKIASAILDAVIELSPKIGEAVKTIILSLVGIIESVYPEYIRVGIDLFKALLQGIEQNIGDIVTLGIEIVVNCINAIKSKIGDLIQAGIDLAISFINGLASGIDNNADRFVNAIDHLISSVLSLLVKAALKFVDRGADFIAKLLSGINKMQGEILKKIVELAAQLLEKIGVKSEWVKKGKDFIQGLIDGFVEMRDQAVKLIKSIGKNIIDGIKGVFDEHSPSKEAHDIGAFFMRGMDNGFIEYGKRVQGSAVRISEDILDTFKTIMSAVSDYISSDYEPTITPVMDLSNVTAGAGDINKLFENTKTQELAWQASANGNFNVMTDLTKQLNSKFDSFNNDDVVSELAGLRSDMTAMNERLGRMQVVMDTGTLVGALGPGMDNYLGNMSVLAGRGV